MKTYYFTLTVLCTFLSINISSGQQKQTGWSNYIQRVFDPLDTESIGYIDEKGDTVLPAIYNPVLSHDRIYTVGAVSSYDRNIGQFYINKLGKKFGRDSLWAWDFSFDVESEGFIRFAIRQRNDRNTHREGMFYWKGNIRIPADYNLLTSMKNGFVFAIKDAKSEPIQPGSEYYNWVGGKKILLDSTNNILVSNQIEIKKVNEDIDYYSYQIAQDSIKGKINIKMDNGKYLSFDNLKKDFLDLVNSQNSHEKLLLDSIFIDTNRISQSEFLKSEEYNLLKKKLKQTIKIEDIELTDFSPYFKIEANFLTPYMEQKSSDQQFRKKAVIELSIRYAPKKGFTYTFIRSEGNNYKLVQVQHINYG